MEIKNLKIFLIVWSKKKQILFLLPVDYSW